MKRENRAVDLVRGKRFYLLRKVVRKEEPAVKQRQSWGERKGKCSCEPQFTQLEKWVNSGQHSEQ